ncbi:hypothetical protein CMALT430_70069 [Carnobacterium maltaromaticum]|uniref:phosphopantetheine-binding protein n=1 Tax=Carnobacterium maltaromaticum TaxID=2751 RepID=UPI00191BA882|nr:phosphopantetheine-binding protein [Carnobacterium maltaromaticum]CAD5901773.1 hypothetical protein CMALT430_70069 [Carnobacterium maltaromaticum]
MRIQSSEDSKRYFDKITNGDKRLMEIVFISMITIYEYVIENDKIKICDNTLKGYLAEVEKMNVDDFIVSNVFLKNFKINHYSIEILKAEFEEDRDVLEYLMNHYQQFLESGDSLKKIVLILRELSMFFVQLRKENNLEKFSIFVKNKKVEIEVVPKKGEICIPIFLKKKIEKQNKSQFWEIKTKIVEDKQQLNNKILQEKNLWIANIWSKVLQKNIEEFNDLSNFFEVGGDSLSLLQVQSEMKKIGKQVSLKRLVITPTLENMAGFENDMNQKSEKLKKVLSYENPVSFSKARFLNLGLQTPSHFNNTWLFPLKKQYTKEEMEGLVELVLQNYPSLNLNYFIKESCWYEKWKEPDLSTVFHYHDISMIKNIDVELSKIERQRESEINIFDGNSISIDLIKGTTVDYILFIAHKTILDFYSLRILEKIIQNKENLNSDYYIEYSNQFLLSKRKKELEVNHQQVVLNNGKEIDTNYSTYTVNNFSTNSLSISEIEEKYYKALATVLMEQNNQKEILIELGFSGRNSLISDLDLSDTIGWFEINFPVHFSRTKIENIRYQINEAYSIAVEKQKELIDSAVIEYQNQLNSIEYSIDFQGAFNSSLDDVDKRISFSERSPENKRLKKLEISGWVSEGKLFIRWNYNPSQTSESTIKNMMTKVSEVISD